MTDDSALVEALCSGHVAAAGLDVVADEPAIHPAYREIETVFALPHTGSAASDTRWRMSELLCVGIGEELAGRAADTRVRTG